MHVNSYILSDTTRGDPTTDIRVELLRVLEDEIPPGEK